MPRLLPLILGLILVACGGTEAEPDAYPVAFRVEHGRLDYEHRDGIAWSDWGNDTLLALHAYLGERDIQLPITDAEPPTYVFTADDRAELGAKLHRVSPPRDELGDFAAAFFGSREPWLDEAMADYLRIVKLAVRKADARHDVVIPVID